MWLYPHACQGDFWWRVMCWLRPKGSRTRLGDISTTDGVREIIIPTLFRLVQEQKQDIVMTISVSSRALFRSAYHDEPLFAEVQFRRRPDQLHNTDHQFRRADTVECSTVLRTPPASPPNDDEQVPPPHFKVALPSSLSLRRRRPRPQDAGDEDDELFCERALRLKTTPLLSDKNLV